MAGIPVKKKQRIAIVGAGLSGSVLAARLRNSFDVTVVEQGRRKRPLFDESTCTDGGINSSINRGAGLGGTTNYWHNALVELVPDELRGAGIEPSRFNDYYRQAWSLFLSDTDLATCRRIRDANAASLPAGRAAHMVVPQARANLWEHAHHWFPGDPITVVLGHAERLAEDGPNGPTHLLVRNRHGLTRIEADRFIFSAGGLATPVLLASSLGIEEKLCGGYHDHPMAYVAKLRLRPSSTLRDISCQDTNAGSVRTGFVYESEGLKSVFYLRPALTLGVASITGEARYVLSDLRNDPFSPRKILQLLTNIEALREAVLFKTRAGFRGDYYSVLMLGEQRPTSARGVRVSPGRPPALNWEVTPEEHAAHAQGFAQFLDEMSPQIADSNLIPADRWEYRTAAHHSGGARDFLASTGADGLEFFAVRGLPNTSVCDASLLQRGGIANSGLTLVALCLRLADDLEQQHECR